MTTTKKCTEKSAQVTFSEHSRNIQGTFKEHSRNISYTGYLSLYTFHPPAPSNRPLGQLADSEQKTPLYPLLHTHAPATGSHLPCPLQDFPEQKSQDCGTTSRDPPQPLQDLIRPAARSSGTSNAAYFNLQSAFSCRVFRVGLCTLFCFVSCNSVHFDLFRVVLIGVFCFVRFIFNFVAFDLLCYLYMYTTVYFIYLS